MRGRQSRDGSVMSTAFRCALCVPLLLLLVAAGAVYAAASNVVNAASTAPTGPASSSSFARGLYYSDTPPQTPFDLGRFLTIQEQEAITRVVDGFLRLTGEAAATPIRVLPGVSFVLCFFLRQPAIPNTAKGVTRLQRVPLES